MMCETVSGYVRHYFVIPENRDYVMRGDVCECGSMVMDRRITVPEGVKWLAVP